MFDDLTIATGILMLVMAGLGSYVYFRAIRAGLRVYTHVVGAFIYVLLIESVALDIIDTDFLLLAHLVGIFAFFSLYARFK